MDDGTSLFVDRRGDGPARPVVAVHGFAQDHRCLGPLAERLAARGPLLAVDAPGHGRSAAVAADLPATAQLLAAVASGAGSPVDLLGYSMGGRAVLQTLVDQPGAAASAVVVGATAGIDDDVARAARAGDDAATAARIEDLGVAAFVEEWLALPMFAGLPRWARFEEVRRSATAAGLAGSLRRAGTGAMAPLWDRLGGVAVPVLCVVGAEDAKFLPLTRRLAGTLPRGELCVVPGAGHAAHLEQPELVADAVVAFLDRSA